MPATGLLETCVVTLPTDSPAAVERGFGGRARLADRRRARATCAGPLDTITVTGLPSATSVPADGSVEIT